MNADSHHPGNRPRDPEDDQQGTGADEARRILPSSRYSLLVGLIFAAITLVALYNTITSREAGTLGFGDEKPGTPLAHFAVPDVTSNLEGDANIDPEAACEVDVPGAIRLCDFADRPLVISFWFTRSGDCTGQQDVISAVNKRYGGEVGFLSINVRDERDQVEELVDLRGWSMPVGHDRDGALSNLYRVGGCPTFVFARPGLKLHEATIGELDAEELSARVEELIRASESRSQKSEASTPRRDSRDRISGA